MKKENNNDLLHNGIIYKILSSLLYLIAYPILFLITKLLLGLRIEGRENLEKVGDEYIVVANHINTIDCAMIAISIFPRVPYFLTLQSNLEIPIIKYIVMLLRGIPIPKNINGKKKIINTVKKLLKGGEVIGIYPEGHLIPYYDGLRKFKNGAFNLSANNQVPIVPILFTYREPDGIMKMIKKKSYITLKILEPEYPKKEISKCNIEKLKNDVYRKMKNELTKNKIYNKELDEEQIKQNC